MEIREEVGNAVGRWVMAACLWGMILLLFAGCGTISHALNVPTLDDLEGVRSDQAKVDRMQANVTADVLTLQALPSDIVDATEAAIKDADASYRARTPPPVPGGGPDWNVIIPAVAGALGLGAGAYATVKTRANTKSIAETDAWIEKDIEPKVAKA